MSYFELYNKKHNEMSNEALDWHQVSSDGGTKAEDFKNDSICTHIMNEESSERSFLKYLYMKEFMYKVESEEASGHKRRKAAAEAREVAEAAPAAAEGGGEEKKIEEKVVAVEEKVEEKVER
jgi:hypothetical protein